LRGKVGEGRRVKGDNVKKGMEKEKILVKGIK
jgi:hypothetical protein